MIKILLHLCKNICLYCHHHAMLIKDIHVLHIDPAPPLPSCSPYPPACLIVVTNSPTPPAPLLTLLSSLLTSYSYAHEGQSQSTCRACKVRAPGESASRAEDSVGHLPWSPERATSAAAQQGQYSQNPFTLFFLFFLITKSLSSHL